MDERDVLLKAASIVEESWCQGNLWEPADTGRAHCALGALFAASQHLGTDQWRVESKAFGRLIRQLKVESLIVWNDTPGRTKWEVADAMRRAAE